MGREVTGRGLGDRTSEGPSADDAIVIENGDTVGGQPDITLHAAGSEAKRQFERLDRVLRCIGSRTAMGEADGGSKRRESGHPNSLPHAVVVGLTLH